MKRLSELSLRQPQHEQGVSISQEYFNLLTLWRDLLAKTNYMPPELSMQVRRALLQCRKSPGQLSCRETKYQGECF
jgi:hypothetical protein